MKFGENLRRDRNTKDSLEFIDVAERGLVMIESASLAVRILALELFPGI